MEAQVDFETLPSPILFQGDRRFAFRDPAAVYHDGAFYLYFTLSEMASDGGYYNLTAYSISSDLVHWTFPRAITPRDRALNFSSPGNIVRYADEWVMCLQTYPTPNLETFGSQDSRIWTLRSTDLETWSEPELLRVKGSDVARGDMGRMIDPYLIRDDDGVWWCFYKQNGVSMSYSDDLETWTYAGHARAGENVTVIRDGSEYVMFHSPSNGIGVKRSTDPKAWGEDVQHLTLGQADWPWAQSRLTAATVLDLRDEPAIGRFVMFYHGDTEEGKQRQAAHGAASLGIAWSDDCYNWIWPGKT